MVVGQQKDRAVASRRGVVHHGHAGDRRKGVSLMCQVHRDPAEFGYRRIRAVRLEMELRGCDRLATC